MGTLTCKIRQRAQKLQREKSRCFAQKRRKLESSKIRVPRLRGSFNQRARDSSSLEHTKIPRRIVRFLVGFSFFWMLAHLCTLLHTGGKAVFFLALSAFCASWRNLSGQSPSILLRKTAPSLKSPTGAFIATLRLQTRIFHTFFRRTAGG